MAGKPRIQWRPNGLHELREAPGPVKDLEARGRRVLRAAERSGGKYVFRSAKGEKAPSGRHRVSITTADWKARRTNARNHTLIRAVDSGR
ncbi:hypothetical protein NN4_64960 [Nocardia ninae NBRC 108245]|uniref:Uncharacterized protein n=1 Tax=Nocardia ninae NBRC 108245 TaxID=1210091 RepID=A0A511MPA8_9NOCA|nr:hypothetical protein NN4_64960 [Nocardia ninae NBRC 108245]